MTGLYDRDVLEATLSGCIADLSRVPPFISANGGELLDFGENRLLYCLARHVAELFGRGETFEHEIATSVIAESTGADRGDVDAVLREIKGRGAPGAFPLFLDHLRSLRFRRRLASIGERAQNGCPAADLVKAVTTALREGEARGDDLVFADLTGPPQPTPPALVGRPGCTLVPAGKKIGIVADSGSGKTHLLVPLALGIAAGRKVLDFDCKQGPVLYISSDDDSDLVRKFQRHAAGMKLDLKGLPLRVVDDPDFNMDEPGAVAQVRRALADLGADQEPATFILECLTTNVSTEKTELNDGASVRAYFRRTVATLQRDFAGLTVIVSHHLKKSQAGGANDLATRISNSVQIRAGADLVICLVKNGEEQFTVRMVKRSRSGARFDAFRVRIVGDPDAPLTLQDEGPIEASLEVLQGASGAVLALLRAAGGPRSLTAIVEGVEGFKKRAVQTACKRLAEQDAPPLVRLSSKPACYALATPKQTDLELGGLD